MNRVARLELETDPAPIEFEADVEADRPDRRAVAGPETDAAAELREIEVRRPREHVAAVDEERGAEITQHRGAKLRVEDDFGIAAAGKPGRRNRCRHADGIQSVAADGRVAADEESLARRQIAHGDGLRIAVYGRLDQTHERPRQPEPRSAGKHEVRPAKVAIDETLDEPLREADFGTQQPRGNRAVRREQCAALWLERIVTG